MDLSEVSRVIGDSVRRGLAPLRTRAPLGLAEWAERHFYLSAESSYVETTWTAWPFQLAMLHAIGSDRVRACDVVKSARVGYTKMLLAAILYNAHHRRRNQGVWNPTDADSDEFTKTDLEPALRDVECMRDVWTPDLAKNRANTLRTKLFRGSSLHLRGGKAAKNYRRLSLDVAYIDELDGFDDDIEKEGAPDKLVAKRVEGATWPKLITGSAPKLKGLSKITARAESADVLFRWHVPCAHCGELHGLAWTAKPSPEGITWDGPGLKWANADAATAAHECPHCAALMTQAEYLQVWTGGLWMGDDGSRLHADGVREWPDGRREMLAGHVAFHVWTACAPLASWSAIVAEYLEALAKKAKGDDTALKTFTNTTLGLEYEAKGEAAESKDLKARAEPYPLRRVPRGALALTCGIDVQDNRLELETWGFGRGEEMWCIDYTVLHGDPAMPDVWNAADAYLSTRFPHDGGQWIGIDATAIDSGGHHTHAVYRFAATRQGRRVFATKGHNVANKPIVAGSSLVDINIDGKIEKHGARLWMVGTDTAKDLLFARLRLAHPGPGYAHLSAALPDAFFEGLASEQRVETKAARGRVTRWVKRSSSVRNEPLDCAVLALFAAHRLDLHRYTDAMWTRLERILCPVVRDMFSDTSAAEVPTPAHLNEKAEGATASAGAEAPPAEPNTTARSEGRPPSPEPRAAADQGTGAAASVPASQIAAAAIAAARRRSAPARPAAPRAWRGF